MHNAFPILCTVYPPPLKKVFFPMYFFAYIYVYTQLKFLEKMKLIDLFKESLISEHGRYDLVSQFKMKNSYLTSLGLDEDGIETLQDWVNLLTVDDSWKKKAYPPEGLTSVNDVIADISKVTGRNIKSYVDSNKSKNPVAVANYLKDAILKNK